MRKQLTTEIVGDQKRQRCRPYLPTAMTRTATAMLMKSPHRTLEPLPRPGRDELLGTDHHGDRDGDEDGVQDAESGDRDGEQEREAEAVAVGAQGQPVHGQGAEDDREARQRVKKILSRRLRASEGGAARIRRRGRRSRQAAGGDTPDARRRGPPPRAAGPLRSASASSAHGREVVEVVVVRPSSGLRSRS